MADEIEALYEKAQDLSHHAQGADALKIYKQIIAVEDIPSDHAEAIRCKELSIHHVGDILCRTKKPEELRQLLLQVRGFFNSLPKAKTAKMTRKLFDQIFLAGASPEMQVSICDEMIDWAAKEKLTFLRHRLVHRLAQVRFEQQEALKAITVITALLKEVRRLEDKPLLVDVHLLESKVYHSIKNHSKARAALVAARTNANAIYCPPLAQAEIDMQSGVLHAEEKDNKTAFSYLYEAFEGFHSLGDRSIEARRAMKYMILTKILTDKDGDELRQVLAAKSVLEYRGEDIDVLREVAEAYKKKDTHMFNAILERNKANLNDPIIQTHLKDMYDKLLENHLLKIVQPYSRVQLDFIADTLKLDVKKVESRLSQMILDQKLNGIVDQQHMCLVIFEEQHPTELYTESLTTLDNVGRFVDALFDKVAGKFDHLSAEAIQKKEEEEKQQRAEKRKKEEEELAAKKKKTAEKK